MVIGDKSTLAIELNGSPASQDGFILLYVNGVGFGQTEFNYNVTASLRLLDALMNVTDHYAPDLLELSAEDIWQIVGCLHDDHRDGRFVSFEKYFEKIDEQLIVRLDYAFDQCLVVIAASKAEEKVFAVDPGNSKSESRTAPVGTFHSLVGQARIKWNLATAGCTS